MYDLFTSVAGGGGFLTEAKLNAAFEEAKKAGSDPLDPVIMLSTKQLHKLKKKHPEWFKAPYKCTWQQLHDELYGPRTPITKMEI